VREYKLLKAFLILTLVLVLFQSFSLTAIGVGDDPLTRIISSIGAADTTLEISTQQNATDNLIIPANVTLRFNQGGTLNITAAKTVTINGHIEAGLYQIFEGDGTVLFGAGSVKEVCADWFGTTGAAIQSAINAAALYVKKVSIGSGTWLINTEIAMPTVNTSWGIEVSGYKAELGYDWDEDTHATTLKANAAIFSVINNRDGISVTSAQYNTFKNLTINGNNQANYGYINGMHDELRDSTVKGCTVAGIYCATYTNSSFFTNVACVVNYGHGAVLAGEWSTVTYWTNCMFRGNALKGIIIYSTVAAHFTNCIFEHNVQQGTYLYRPVSTSEQQIFNLKFTKCYWESNGAASGGYQIVINGVGASCWPMNILFDQPHIVSGADGRLGVQILYGYNIKFQNPVFTGDNLITAGWFNVAASPNVTQVAIEGLSDAANHPTSWTVDGAGAANIVVSGNKVLGTLGTYITNASSANIIKTQTNIPTTRAVTALEVCGSIITNYGQAAADITITLPAASEKYSFLAVVLTGQAANAWIIQAVGGGNLIYFNGALVATVRNSPAVLGSAIRLTAAEGAGYYWIAEVISGTWI